MGGRSRMATTALCLGSIQYQETVVQEKRPFGLSTAVLELHLENQIPLGLWAWEKSLVA